MSHNRFEQFQSEKQREQFCKEQKCFTFVYVIGRRIKVHEI